MKNILIAAFSLVLIAAVVLFMLFITGVIPRSIEDTTMPPGYTLLTDGTVYGLETPRWIYSRSWKTVARVRRQAWYEYHEYADREADAARIWLPVEEEAL